MSAAELLPKRALTAEAHQLRSLLLAIVADWRRQAVLEDLDLVVGAGAGEELFHLCGSVRWSEAAAGSDP